MSLIADALRAAERERAARKAQEREDALARADGDGRLSRHRRQAVLRPLAIAAVTAAATAGLVLWLRSRSR